MLFGLELVLTLRDSSVSCSGLEHSKVAVCKIEDDGLFSRRASTIVERLLFSKQRVLRPHGLVLRNPKDFAWLRGLNASPRSRAAGRNTSKAISFLGLVGACPGSSRRSLSTPANSSGVSVYTRQCSAGGLSITTRAGSCGLPGWPVPLPCNLKQECKTVPLKISTSREDCSRWQ